MIYSNREISFPLEDQSNYSKRYKFFIGWLFDQQTTLLFLLYSSYLFVCAFFFSNTALNTVKKAGKKNKGETHFLWLLSKANHALG